MKSLSAAILAALSLTLALTACSANPNSGSSSQNTENSTNSPTSTTDPNTSTPDNSGLNIERAAQETTGDPTDIIAPDGNPIYISDITTFTNDSGDPAQYAEGAFGTAECEGFAYIAPPSELCLTSLENSDIYDESTLSFSGVPDTQSQDYVRINIGDKVNGLTVESARTEFIINETNINEAALAKYFTSTEVSFSGQLTLEGYAVAIPEDAYGVMAGDILFVPQGNCPLPVMSFKTTNNTDLHYSYFTGSNYGLTWVNQYGQIFLGNICDTTADISCLSYDGTFTKVTVTVDNIRMNSAKDWLDTVQADIVNIEWR